MSPDRRTFLTGAGLAALAAGTTSVAGCSSPAPEAEAPDAASSGVSVPTGEVPVDGGVILEDASYVVTQPSAGVYKAFSSTCTHQGCTVKAIENREIVCPCHGARFSIEDGSVVVGPATEALPEAAASVDGDAVVIAP
ncbi:MAG: Rieske (2Fe-2S) protein [Propioniciclava sp.]